MSFPAHLRSCWYVACLASELKRAPRACTVLDQHLALFRDGEGRPAALLDRCPHRNAPLSKGRVCGGRLVCPYHGWEFDRSGRCQATPGSARPTALSKCDVPAYPAVEDGLLVWVAGSADPPAAGPPRHHLAAGSGRTTLVRTFTLEAPLLDAMENFLDATHTHFVHAGLVRGGAARQAVRATLRPGPDRVEAEYLGEGRQSGLIGRLLGRGQTHSIGRFLLPATAQLEYRSGERVTLLITLYFTPREDDRHQVCAVLSAAVHPLAGRLLSGPFGWLLWRVVRQDQRILRLQSANVRRFGGAGYASTELDLMRPHISRLLAHGPLHTESFAERQVNLML